MQHLDEGRLQAWLDHPLSGLSPETIETIERHLAACSECATHAEELRRDTVEMTSFFQSVHLAHDLPEYSVVVAPTRHARRVHAGLRMRRLGWAASVIVALGVGWLAGNASRAPGSGTSDRTVARTAPTATAPTAFGGLADGGGAGAQPTSPTGAPVQQPTEPTSSVPPVVVASGPEPSPSGDPRASAAPSLAAAARTAPSNAAPSDVAAGAVAPRDAPPGNSPSGNVAPADAAPRSPSGANAGPASTVAERPAAGPAASEAAWTVVGRVTDDESGRPVPAAQVFIADLDVGVLTQPDGSFRLTWPRDPSDREQEVTVTVQRIGFREQTRDLVATRGVPVTADFGLVEEALQLDEIVVTGVPAGAQRRAIGNAVTAAPAAPPTPASTWRPVGRTAAEAEAGFVMLTVPDLPLLGIEISVDGAIRVLQGLDGRAALTLTERVGDAPPQDRSAPSGHRSAAVTLDGVTVTAVAPLSADSLWSLLERLR